MTMFLRVAVARIRGFLRPDGPARELDEELAAHLEMAIDDKIRQGLSPEEARRRARVELGNLELLREEGRAAWGLPWIGSSWLDVRLGFRMLRKSWGLSLVAGLALTVVIGLAAVAFDVLGAVGGTELPLAEGDRVVALVAWDAQAGEGVPTSWRDFERWRETLRSIEDVGAFRTVERNLRSGGHGAPGAPAEVVPVAEITASAFALARVSAALGRPLLPEDEAPAAEPVLVLGHEAWQRRFGGDPGVLGREVRLDGVVHTVVGVMPEGFGFPVSHRYWIALRDAPTGAAAGVAGTAAGADLVAFARLGPGVTMATAEAELRRVGLLPTAGSDEGRPRPAELRVVPYVTAFTGTVPGWAAGVILLLVTLLLIPPCVNVAALVYARTVNRQGELAARYVLGASRFNIVAQLFVELLVLAAGAAAVALVASRVVAWQILEDLRRRGDAVPFWMDFGLSARTVLVVAGLAVVAATIAGVVPALQATGRGMQAGLRTLSGRFQPRLGRVWTSLVVLQVAFSFALLPTAVEMTWGTLRSGLLGPGFPAGEYLTARLEAGAGGTAEAVGAGGDDAGTPVATRWGELARALAAEPEVAALTLLADVPGDEPWARVEIDEDRSHRPASAGEITVGTGRLARVNHVDPTFFDAFELPVLTGRPFEAGDFAGGGTAVIVNRSFVREVLGGGDPLGRRFRYPARDHGPAAAGAGAERWYEIVGVAADLRRHAGVQTVYHPAPPQALAAVSLALRARSDPAAAAAALREVAWALDPALRLSRVESLDAIYRQKAAGDYLGASGLVAATLSVLLLSAAGLYALLSFTVDRQRREIGIRLALGARPARLLASVFVRSLGQVGAGALGGVLIALLIGLWLPVQAMGGWEVPGVLPVASAFMVAIALLALAGPARRGLRVQPIDELREG
ncbi:MAG TPA: ABC transporter permease [Thermoanaerobaculia bacterium]|nr:ABC transporter permease [Thermoanaerobaculia bacterium]